MNSPSRSSRVDAAVIVLFWLFMVQLVLAPWGHTNSVDDVVYSTPHQQLTLDAFLDGRAPLWNPYTFGGTPHLGNLQTAALYPGNLLAAPFPDLLGADVELAAHVLLLGFGWYWLGRRLRLARPAPLVMGLLAMGCGATVMRMSLLVHLPPLAWVPIAMVGLHAIGNSSRPWRAVAFTAAVLCMVVTSGHPQSVLMAGTFLAAWTVGVVVERREPRRLGHVAAAGALAALMAAPTLAAGRASIAAAAASSRNTDTLRTAGFFAHPSQVVQTVFGRPLGTLAEIMPNFEATIYVGAGACGVAVLGLLAVVRRRAFAVASVALVAGFGLAMSFGMRSPVFRAARRWLPGFDQPRISARWLWLLAMGIVLLAGVGVDALRREDRRTDAWWVVGSAVAVGLTPAIGMRLGGAATAGMWLLAALAVAAARWFPSGVARRASVVVLAAVMLLEIGVPVVRMAQGSGGDTYSTSTLTGPAAHWLSGRQGFTLAIVDENYDDRYLVAGMRPNASILSQVRTIDGYDGGVAISTRWIAAVHQLLPAVNDVTVRAQLYGQLSPARLARLGVRYALYDPRRGPVAQTFGGWRSVDIGGGGDFVVLENPAWKGDTTVWYAAREVGSPVSAGDTIREHFPEVQQTALVERGSLVLECATRCTADHVESRAIAPGERTAVVDARRPALVAFAEQYDEGWTATVDGHDAAVVPVDGAWAGVQVTPGRHTIRLTYAPSWWWPSVLLALVAWLSAATVCVAPRLRRRPRTT